MCGAMWVVYSILLPYAMLTCHADGLHTFTTSSIVPKRRRLYTETSRIIPGLLLTGSL